MSVPLVDIIIINWNAKDHTVACLEAVMPQAKELGDSIVTVVDNGSTDGSIAAIPKRYPTVRFLPLGENSGFTGGIAAGLARSKAEHVVFLNNDAVPEKGWLESLVSSMAAADEDVVSVAGKIIDMSGTRIDFIGGVLTFDGHAFQESFRKPLGSVPEPEAGSETLFACGGNMISRRKRLLALGGLDDDYFAYLEDVDFGWRTWLAGGRVTYQPAALVRHVSSATSERLGNIERGVLFEKNALQTIFKHAEESIFAEWLAPTLFTYLHRLHHYTTTRNGNTRELTRSFGTPPPPRSRVRKKPLATISDPLAAMQFRALEWVFTHSEELAKKRAAVQALRKRSDHDIFARFPLHLVPTYPGDEEMMANPLFRLLRPKLSSIDSKLGDIMRSGR